MAGEVDGRGNPEGEVGEWEGRNHLTMSLLATKLLHVFLW